MSALPDLVFVTYHRTTPIGQMGVFKRCTRLIEHLTDAYHVHLVNFGPLPEHDAQFASVRDRITIHDVPDGDLAPALMRTFAQIHPRAVVFGEAPLRGSMRVAHRVATKLQLRQIAIENTYHRAFAPFVTAEYPAIDRWLLMGPLENGFPERLSEKVLAVPAFLRYPPHFGTLQRDRVTVVGYDLRSLAMGVRLLQFVPADEPFDFLISPAGRDLLSGIERANMRVLELPDDITIYDSLARAKYVIGKAGYGQITEALMLGAPIVARMCGGGIRDEWVSSFLRPYVRVLRSELDLNGVPDLPRPVRFEGVAAAIPDTTAFAAQALQSLLDGTSIELPGRNGRDGDDEVEPAHLFGVYRLKHLLEERRWQDLHARLNGCVLWMFDGAMQPGPFIAMLENVFGDAADLKLLLLALPKVETRAGVSHVTAQAVLLWGEHHSWKEHELEFDLHVGWRGQGGECTFAYIGATVPTPIG